jgi:hypothetical protein
MLTAMWENTSFISVAIVAVGFLCVLALVRLAGLSGRVARLERALTSAREQPPEREFLPERESREETTVASSGAFEIFLEENPARRNLPKNEQFTAFRRWRAEKGLNWRAPADPR